MKTTAVKLGALLACAASLALAGGVHAQTRYEVMHTFSGNRGRPLAALTEGPDGKLYGTTIAGGTYGKGSIYAIDATGASTTIHEFSGSDGQAPRGRLVLGSDGALYGTTSQSTDGFGTVFRFTPGGSVETLAEFTGVNGKLPQAGLVQASDQHFYGTTLSGGATENGTIFRLTLGGVLTTLVSFDGALNGAFPGGDLIQAADGNLYGSTQQGGTQQDGAPGAGTVFRAGLDGTLTTLVTFNGANGANPSDGPIQASDGTFYGTTVRGGESDLGTLFKLVPGGVETIVSFSGANGALPSGALRELSGGSIYGTTQDGGANFGTIFRYSLDGGFATLASFTSSEGIFPGGGVIQASSGAIFGTTVGGGAGGYGTVFELMPDATLRTVVSFVGAAGADPSGRLMRADDGHFYGTTSSGGSYGHGTIFRLTADGFLTTMASFAWTNGAGPSGGLMQASDGHLYGTTEAGGITGDGTVFRMTLDGTLQSLGSFDIFVNGAVPLGGLIEGSDGLLYGTTFLGKDFAPGSVFKVARDSETESDSILAVATFDGMHGESPTSGLMEGPDGYFYGTAEAGGPDFSGTVFRMSLAGEVSTAASFTGPDGAFPAARLVLGTDGNLYGTTSGGGESGNGTLFQLAPDGTLTSLASFDFVNGAFPYQQGLVEADGFLYGTAMFGGADDKGTVYRWAAETGIEVVHNFDGVSGDGPNSTLIADADGLLYGTAIGPRGGVIYRIVPENEEAVSLDVAPASAIYGGVTTLSATLSRSGPPIEGAEIAFSLNGAAVGSAITGADGIATLADVSAAGLDAGSYPGAIAASFAETHAAGDLTIAQATPKISVDQATYIYDGNPRPATGTVIGVGDEALGPLTFTYNGNAAPPVDPGSYTVVASYEASTNYESATATAVITILPAPPGLDGLVAAYGFNEGGGRYAGDASGHGNAGRTKRSQQWVSNGRFGGALDFDGENDWVTIGDDAALDIRNAITIEAWVNPRALSGWNTIVLKEGDDRLAYALYANDDAPRPAGYVSVFGTDQSVAGSGALPLNTWSHVAMTYNGSIFRLYVNGVEVGQRNLTGRILATSGVLRIGGNDIWDEYFKGMIDEVRIYGRALSASEIARDMNMPIAYEATPPSVKIDSPLDGAVLSGIPSVTVSASDNLVLSTVHLQVDGVDMTPVQFVAPFAFRVDAANGTHVLRAVARDAAGNMTISDPITITIANAPVADYGFEESDGSTVIDASGRNNTGTLSGGARRITDLQRGRVMSFNGIDSLVSVADAASLDLTTGMTLEAWVRPTTTEGWRTVLLKEGDQQLSYALYANGEVRRPAGLVRIDSVDEEVRGTRALTSGAWSHLAMTYDGAMMRLFVNGVEVENDRQSGSADVTSGKLRIGGNKLWGEWFNGQIDNVRIYDVAVSAAQIKADMNR